MKKGREVLEATMSRRRWVMTAAIFSSAVSSALSTAHQSDPWWQPGHEVLTLFLQPS